MGEEVEEIKEEPKHASMVNTPSTSASCAYEIPQLDGNHSEGSLTNENTTPKVKTRTKRTTRKKEATKRKAVDQLEPAVEEENLSPSRKLAMMVNESTTQKVRTRTKRSTR